MPTKAVIDKKLQSRLSKIDEIRNELKKAEQSASKDIMNILKELMQQNPLLAGIRWNQYTPSFNDGDVCEFGVNDLEYKFNLGTPSKSEDDEDYDNGEDGWFQDWDIDDDFFNKRVDILNHKQIPGLKKTIKDVNTVFEKLRSMESNLQQMFGDGVQITVTSEGVETEDYDHD